MRVLVTGARGQLGHDLCRAFVGHVAPGGRRRALYGPEGDVAVHDVEVLGTDYDDAPVDDRARVLEAATTFRPDLIVHAGAMTAVDQCETDVARAYRVNAKGTRNMAEAATLVGAHLVYISTDYVFDGTSPRPYVEWDQPNPMSVYGKSKLGGEHECPPGATIIRTSWVCGYGGANMVKTVLRLVDGDGPLRFVDDQHGCPTFTADLAAAVVTLGGDRAPGVFHVTNQEATTWFGFVRTIVQMAGGDPHRVEPITTAELDPPRPAPRPANSVLENAALVASGRPLLPDWQDGLARLLRALGHDPVSGG